MTRGLTLLFAIASGVAVGNLYWAQPLLDTIAADLRTSTPTAGWVITATQLGYAVGVLLIVPLGDTRDRRRLIPFMMLCATVALVTCALAPTIGVLIGVVTALGATTVAGQLLTPLAGDLATDADRGQVVGSVVSGLLTGILVSRTVSGLVAGVAGWRAIYVFAAVVSAVVAVLLVRRIPRLEPRSHIAYPALIASVGRSVAREPALRWTLMLGATSFALFTMFWTALTFLLAGPLFHYSVTVIGLFGLAGLAGAIAARRAGRLHDRGWSLPASGAACGLLVVAFLVAAVAGRSVVLVVVAVVLLDTAVQGLNILNQTRILSIATEARSRLNTTLVTSNFVGGTVGSAAATLIWPLGGWTAVCLAGAIVGLAATSLWAVGRRGPLIVRRADAS